MALGHVKLSIRFAQFEFHHPPKPWLVAREHACDVNDVA